MSIQFTKEQRSVIDHQDGDLLVSAAAGSGKTAVLVARVLRMLTDPVAPVPLDRLLIVTFTNAAAAQMKEKIEKELSDILMERPDDRFLEEQYRLVQKAHIQTNHSFSLYVLQNYITQLPGLDPGFRVADEAEADLLRIDVLRESMEYFYSEAMKPELTPEASDFLAFADAYSGARQDQQLEKIVLSVLKHMVSEPDPTGWLDRAVHRYEISPETGKPYFYELGEDLVRNEKKRLDKAFDRFFKAYIFDEADEQAAKPQDIKKARDFADAVRGIRDSLEGAEDLPSLYKLAGEISWPRGVLKIKGIGGEGERSQCLEDLKERAKSLRAMGQICFDPYQLQVAGTSVLPAMRGMKALILHFLKAFRQEKNRRNILEISDFEHYTLELLENEAICNDLRKQFMYIYVDEYQDINKVQETILGKICRRNEQGQSINMFMVGDVKQSIYGFRQADPSLFLEKYKTYGRLPGTSRLLLGCNFRSRGIILDSVNYLFSSLMTESVGGLDYGPEEALYQGVPESDGDDCAKVRLTVVRAEEKASKADLTVAEADLIATQIEEEMARGTSPKDIVILLRATTKSQIYIDGLRKHGIMALSDSSLNFYDTLEIRYVVNLLRTIDNPRQDIPLFGVLSSPVMGFSEDDIGKIRLSDREGCLFDALTAYREKGASADLVARVARFQEDLAKWRTYAGLHSVYDLIWRLYMETDLYLFFSSMPQGSVRAANLDLLISKAVAFENGTYHGLYAFLRYIEQMDRNRQTEAEARPAEEHENAVRIMTIHKSKGLEFPVVFVAGLDQGWNKQDLKAHLLMDKGDLIGAELIDPETHIKRDSLIRKLIVQRKEKRLIAEEIRLLYVAMTRAMDRLYLSGVRKDDPKKPQADDQKRTDLRLQEEEILGASDALSWIEAILRKKEGCPFEHVELTTSLEDIPEAEFTVTPELEEDQGAITEPMKEQLSYRYPYLDLGRIPQLLSVSTIKKDNMAVVEEELSEESPSTQLEISDEHLSGSERGTLFHNILASADPKLLQEGKIDEALETLVSQHIVRESDLPEIPESWIRGWSQSRIFDRMIHSDEVYREEPFIMLMTLPELDTISSLTDGLSIQDTGEGVMVQGIIDLFFREGEEWVLVDYKTDYLLDEGKLRGYRMQLDLYRKAIERATGRKVKEMLLYDVRRKKEIPC